MVDDPAHAAAPAADAAPVVPPWYVRLRRTICCCWTSIVQFGLVLWIARVPVAMTAIGCLLLWKAPQAQDLFLEFARPTEWPPWLAAFTPGLLADVPRWQIWRIVYFLAILTALWAVPTHYSARLLLDTDQRFHDLIAAESAAQRRRLRCMSRWVPRLLGLLTFVAVLIGIVRSYLNVPILDETAVASAVNFWLVVLWLAVLLAGAGFLVYSVRREDIATIWIVRLLARFNRRLAWFWDAVWPGLRGAPDEEEGRDVGRFLFVVVFALFLYVFRWGAEEAAWWFPRAMAVPFVLGGWMPLLTYLAGAGRSGRVPLILGLFIVVSALALVIGDNHLVRRINAAATAGRSVDTSMMPLEGAVKLWKAENCTTKTAANNTTQQGCPRPIIVASAGGASRAAFFMSSVIGRLIFEAPSNGLSANDIRNRLFAISSVSGSSVGAVMVTAALDAKTDASTHPCGETAVPQWWGVKVGNWQDCFEALTSGDFLTPVFFGFAFNDMFPFWWRDRAAVLEDSWNERFNEIVTRADKPASPMTCKGLGCPFLSLRPRAGHWVPLLVLNGTSEATGGRIVTTVLDSTYSPSAPCPTKPARNSRCSLFTEADSFHELLAADYDPALDSWTGWIARRFLKWLHKGETLDDIALSTAAHNSARFPFISPPGAVRNNGYQQVIDRIVDGGYFENYGAISANELALAIRAVDPSLSPLVLVISNDPDDLLDPSYDSDAAPNRIPQVTAAAARRVLQQSNQYQVQRTRTRARVSGSEPMGNVLTTITAFVNAWPAHGTLAVEDFRIWLHQTNGHCPVQLVHVRVWPQILATGELSSRSVSMSWWLSTPVQRHLHQQLEGRTNQNANMPRLTAIWSAMSGDGGCAKPPTPSPP